MSYPAESTANGPFTRMVSLLRSYTPRCAMIEAGPSLSVILPDNEVMSSSGSAEVFCSALPARNENGRPLLSSPRYNASTTRSRSRDRSTSSLLSTKLSSCLPAKGLNASKATSKPMMLGRTTRSIRISRSCRPPGSAQFCLCVRSRSACADIIDA